MSNIELRKVILKKRWSLALNEKRKMDHIIFQKIINEIEKNGKKEKYVACYWPIENEVDTLGIINHLLKNNYKICLPYIEKNEMFFKPITSFAFPYETWKCLHQPKTKEIVNSGEIDFMIVPLIGFNDQNNRLGYGKNFYNNYLIKCLAIKTVGIAYKFQKTNEIILTEKDVKLGKIITE